MNMRNLYESNIETTNAWKLDSLCEAHDKDFLIALSENLHEKIVVSLMKAGVLFCIKSDSNKFFI